MRTSALFVAKNLGFFEIFGVSARTRRVEPVRTFCGQGERGSIFRDFVRTTLWTVPNCFSFVKNNRKFINFAVINQKLQKYELNFDRNFPLPTILR